jgi:hypothetical protein
MADLGCHVSHLALETAMHPFIARSIIRCWEREATQHPRPARTWSQWLRWRR